MSRKVSRKNSRNDSRNKSRISRLSLLAGLLSTGLSVPALAQSVPFPTYTVGPQPDGSYVVSDGTIINPAGIQVDLGIRVRAKAIALNPTGNHTAAVLTMGTSPSNGNGAVEVFNTQTGAVLQSYSTLGNTDSQRQRDRHHLHAGRQVPAFQPGQQLHRHRQGQCGGHALRLRPRQCSDRRQPLFTFEGTPFAYMVQTVGTCCPEQPSGNRWQFMLTTAAIPVGTNPSSYPLGLAVSPDGKTAYAVLDVNNTLTKIDLTAATPTQGAQIRVGNVPHSVVIST